MNIHSSTFNSSKSSIIKASKKGQKGRGDLAVLARGNLIPETIAGGTGKARIMNFPDEVSAGSQVQVMNISLASGLGMALTGPTVPLAPHHIRLKENEVKKCFKKFSATAQEPQEVFLDGEGLLHLPGESRIDCSRGQLWSGRLGDFLNEESEVVDYHPENILPFLQDVKELLADELEAGELQQSQSSTKAGSDFMFKQYLATRLKKFEGAADWDGRNKALQQLVGAGPGLTPAGDDLLVGFLSLLHFFKVPDLEKIEFEVFGSGKRTEQYRTTLVSTMALLAAQEGSFNQLLVNFYLELSCYLRDLPVIREAGNFPGERRTLKGSKGLKSALRELLNLGSSSGEALLLGIVMGLNFLESEPVQSSGLL